MRVLHVSHTAVVSGAEHSLLALIAALPDEHVGGLACPTGELAERADRLGVPVFTFPELRVSLASRPTAIPGFAWRLMRSAVTVRAAARRTRATVVHANSTRAAIIAMAAWRIGAPPFVAHVRDVLPRHRLTLAINRLIRRRARAVVVLSRFVGDAFCDGADRGAAISIVDNPIAVDRFFAQSSGADSPSGDRRAARLGIVGQISSWKGHDTAVRALGELRPRHSDTKLVIVGDVRFTDSSVRLDNRAFLASLEAEIDRLGLTDRVEFTGQREDVPELMASLDVVLVPSIEEPFGRTVAEAMAAGKPVIATNVGGPRELLEDGVTGLLAPPGDVQAWARAIESLLDDPEEARAIGRRAQAVAIERFDARRHAARMIEILRTASV